MKLDIGCGIRKKEGFIGIDKHKGVNYQINLENDKLPFKDNSIDGVYSYHCLEHISNFDEVMTEIYRVLKKGCIFELYVPYFAYPLVNTPYHKIYFNFRSFNHFEKNGNTMPTKHKFKVIEKKMIFKFWFFFWIYF